MSKRYNKKLQDKCIFKLSTNQGYDVKIWFDALYDTVEKAIFEIGYDGISTCSSDESSGIGIYSMLRIEEFNEYFINPKFFPDVDSILKLPIDAEDLHISLKTVKKGGCISIYILCEDINNLCFDISLKDSKATVKMVINILYDDIFKEPQGYNDYLSFMVSSSDFQKFVKQMIDTDSIITVEGYQRGLKLISNIQGFLCKSNIVGKVNKDDDVIFTTFISSKVMSRIIKINGFKSNIKFYISPDSPLRLSVYIGPLGVMRLYLWDPIV